MITAHALHLIATEQRNADDILDRISHAEAIQLTRCVKELYEFGDYDIAKDAITMPTMKF